MRTHARILLGLSLLVATATACERPWTNPHEPTGRDLFTSPQANPIAITPDGNFVVVANTTSNGISVIETQSNTKITANLRTGIDPVAVGVRPDGKEVWVANHVSDSVSVIDFDYFSPTFGEVIATIQDFHASGSTLLDEPVGIAFASNAKAYVALSSRNQIAVVDVATRTVTSRIVVTAQEPRAIAVANGRLYVPVFESFNQSELSICPNSPINPPQCTLDGQDLADFVIESPNLPGADSRIVIDPDVPDRDLYVYSTVDESLVDVVSGIGTLLYGVAVSSNDHVFITQTEARNEVNGAGGPTNNLIALENRMFLNEIAEVNCNGASCSFNPGTDIIDLDTPPGTPIPAGDELATPYGIALSGDDGTLVVTAAGTSRVFTVDTATGNVLDILDLGSGPDFGQQIPRGVALRSDPGTGAPQTAYVLNTLENTVSVVDVSNPSALALVKKLKVGQDPTPDAVRRGRIAFNNAFASTSGTFSCGSCHPDGNTDQLLWRIGGPCFFGACTGDDEIRSTMPVRGLKNTLPLHWDGSLGDPFGVGNGAYGGDDPAVQPNCDINDDHSCFRQLVNASQSGVMCDQDPSCANGPATDGMGMPLPGLLTNQERDDMAEFLMSVAYPPARNRVVDDLVPANALDGFAQFFVDQPGGFPSDLGDVVGVTTCADMDSGCHALPLGVDTNSDQLAGFDVPTMRGLTDRTLQFSIGITNSEEALEDAIVGGTITVLGFPLTLPPSDLPWDPADGFDEEVTFAAAFGLFTPVYNNTVTNIFKMVEHASTGTSGAVGRQVTLNPTTIAQQATLDLLDGLEIADERDVVNLQGDGELGDGTPVTVSYVYVDPGPGFYQVADQQISRAQLESDVSGGDLRATLTAFLPMNHGSMPQPLLAPDTDADGATGNPDLPVLPGDNPMSLEGIDVHQDAQILVDGEVVSGSIACTGGSFTPLCDSENVTITLTSNPSPDGLHLLQVQNPKGPLSPEMPICVGAVGGCQ